MEDFNITELKEFFDKYTEFKKTLISDYEQKLDLFFNKFSYRKKLFQDFQEEVNRKISSDFNVFDLIDINELSLSNIIALLLDTKGSHGQGRVFLEVFIDCFVKQMQTDQLNKDFKVYTEYAANGNRRIDILLKSSDFAVIIENKPYTYDQQDQITDYISYMEDSHIPNYRGKLLTIYLNKNEDMPKNFSDASKIKSLNDKQKNGEFIIVSYDVFAKTFLQQCYEKCESTRFRYFIADFIEFIEKNPSFINNGEH